MIDSKYKHAKIIKITINQLVPNTKTSSIEVLNESKEIQSPGYDIPPELKQVVTITTLDKVYNWSRRNSLWPMMFGLACCAIEMIMLAKQIRFCTLWHGSNATSPRQADFMIVAGTVTKKMVPQIVRLYNQIAEPRYVVAMGACASGGGPFKEGYSVVSGIDKFLPVDVYIPGCPPTPQALLNGLIALQKKIDTQTIKGDAYWYKKDISTEIPIPILGPDLIDPRRFDEIKSISSKLALEKQMSQDLASDQDERGE